MEQDWFLNLLLLMKEDDNMKQMKDSNTHWIGFIPNEWSVMSVKNIFDIVAGGTPKSEKEEYWKEGQVLWATPKDLSNPLNGELLSTERKITELGLKNSSAKLVPIDSIILSTRAPVGNIAQNKAILSTNQGCKALVKKENIVQRYFFYQLLLTKEELNAVSTGTTFVELSTEKLSNFKLVFPPLKEQQRIANFLDHKTVQLDSIISSKEKQISLLNEFKQSLISETVTKGIFQSKRNQKKLKYHISLEKGKKPNDLYTEGIGIPYVTASTFENGIYKEFTTDENVLKCKKSDILVLWDGARAGLVTTEHEGAVSSTAGRIRTDDFLIPKFAYYLIKSKEKRFFEKVSGTTIPHMSKDFLDEIMFDCFSLEEQLQIVEFLDYKTSQMDSLITQIQAEIEKLKEYKQSLIFEAVTGKFNY